jgi:hypothetical protein
MKPASRKPSHLSEPLQQRLNSYALAATAAGVSVLVLTQPAASRVVYTPAHQQVPRGMPGVLYLDLNHDGIPDFKLENWWTNVTSAYFSSLSVFPAQPGNGNGILGYGTVDRLGWIYFPFAFRAGARIGPAQKRSFFSAKYQEWMYRADAQWGQWQDVQDRYLGLKFMIKGKAHYGWARLNVRCNPTNNKITALLTGYAYETIDNETIVAGKTNGQDAALQPASLGALAAGASAAQPWPQKP